MPLRILHVVWQMHAGGIAHWLMNVLRHIDHSRYRFDFLILREGPCAYAEEIRALGGEVIPCYGHRNPWRIARGLARAVREHGPYDVIHSHVYNYSGLVLRLAAQRRIPVRIAQSHTDARLEEAGRAAWHRLYLALTKNWIRRYATLRLGTSARAAEALFGDSGAGEVDARVIPLGLDFTLFEARHDPIEVRRSLRLPADALVIGHVGNYVWPKNHEFLVEIAAEVLRREPRAWLLLVGHDLQGSPIEAQVQASGVAERVVIAGPRGDVPRLMNAAMDLFLFPSHYEGLGLVLLEAQAAGLPCVVSAEVPEEAAAVPELVHRLPLSESASSWAAAVLERIAHRSIPQEEAYRRMLQSDFNIERSVATVMRIYDTNAAVVAPAPRGAVDVAD